MMGLRRSVALGFVIAACGTGLLLLIDAAAGRGDLRSFLLAVTYFLTILLASAAGGWKPGLLAALLGMGVHLFAFVEPRYRWKVADPAEFLRSAAYVLVGSAISLLSEALHRAWGRIAERQQLLERAELQAREETRRSRRQANLLRVTLSSIGDAVITTDAECRVTFMNRQAEMLTGWCEPEARDRALSDVFHIINERTRAVVEDPCGRVLATGAVVGLANHTVLVRRDGSEIPIEDSAAPISDEAEQVLGVVLVFRDATRERAATNALKRLAAIVSSSHDAVIGIRTDGTITSWNEAAERFYDYSPHEAIGQHIHLIVPDDRRDELAQIMQRLLSGEHIQHFDTVRRRRDGSLRNVSLQISPILDDDGTVIGISKVDRDITERKRTERALMFLTQTSSALAVVTDRTSALQRATRLMVGDFADFCIVHTLDTEGRIQTQAAAHADPQSEHALHELLARNRLQWDAPSPPVQALRSGQTEFLSELPEALIDRMARDDVQRQLLRALAPRSVISVPLRIRGRLVGAITFFASQRQYTESDVSFAEDLAQRVATAVDNAELLDSVRRADRQKDEFLAMLAHELRNPLAAISYANSLMQMSPDASQPELTELVSRQITNLSHLVDDLLDVSRISRDKIQLRRELLDLRAVLRRAVASVQPQIEEKQHRFRVEHAAEALPVFADPTRIEQILTNLLVNAAKFTPPAGEVSVHAVQRGAEAVVCIRDSGVGIPPEMLPRVFDLFAQADRSLDRSSGGLGIGLTIARKLAEMHGGTLTAASEGIGRGAEFTLRLPLSEAPPPDAPDRRQLPATASTLRILVVDDNRDTARMEALLLSRLGHTVDVAYNGADALAAAHSFRPHVILLDIGLPEIDGFEVARRLRADGFTHERLIAVSGYGRPEDIQRSREAGFDHHLVKPVDRNDLLTVLEGAG